MLLSQLEQRGESQSFLYFQALSPSLRKDSGKSMPEGSGGAVADGSAVVRPVSRFLCRESIQTSCRRADCRSGTADIHQREQLMSSEPKPELLLLAPGADNLVQIKQKRCPALSIFSLLLKWYLVEHMPTMPEALGSMPSAAETGR